MGYHLYSQKYAIDFVNERVSKDNSVVVFCSGFPESNVIPIPAKNFTEMHEFYTLAYYPIHGTVVPMRASLNASTIEMLQSFLHDPAYRAKKFYLISPEGDPSIPDWLLKNTQDGYTSQSDGSFNGSLVYEFTPKVN